MNVAKKKYHFHFRISGNAELIIHNFCSQDSMNMKQGFIFTKASMSLKAFSFSCSNNYLYHMTKICLILHRGGVFVQVPDTEGSLHVEVG